MTEFPGNSKHPQPGPKKVKVITTDGVTIKKKGLGRRVGETFVGDDAKGVTNYVIFDVLIPAAKDMIADAVSQGTERLLFGSNLRTRGVTRAGSATSTYTAYNKVNEQKQRQSSSRPGRNNHDFQDIVFNDRAVAQDILEQLFELLSQYEQVTVSDFLESVGEKPSFTDERWGWIELVGTRVERARGGRGFVIGLPKPIELN